jgi:multidrug efflux pump subunit AcrB
VLPSGTAKIGATEYDVAVDANTRTIDELNHLPIKTVNGATIYLSDVAQVHDGYTPQQNAVRQDGVRAALLTIMKDGNASTLDVVAGIKGGPARVMATVSPDLHVKEFADQSLFRARSHKRRAARRHHRRRAHGLMILLFLGSWRSTLIIALSIPLSVLCSIATF